jgi:peptide/nickel transport system substrate-binding protein
VVATPSTAAAATKATTLAVATTAAITTGATATQVATTPGSATTATTYPPLLSGKTVEQVVIAQGVDHTTLDPADGNATPTNNVLNNIYDTLLFWTPDAKLAPRLAESYKQLDDTTWEFKLRKGVKWHDGSDFTAEDVKFTIDRFLDVSRKPRPVQRRSDLVSIKETKVVDPYTIQVVTTTPFPTLPNQLAVEGIVSKKYATGPQGDAILAEKPLGTGPYKFVEWQKNEYIDLVVNPDYWGPAPKVQKVRFRVIPDDQTRLSALQSGSVDLITNVAPELADQLSKSEKVGISSVPSARVIFLIIDTLDPNSPLKDARVRQALNFAIDREGIINTILSGYGIKLSQPLTERHFGYNPNLTPYSYDPTKAKALLAAAGYPNGFELTFNYTTGRYLKDKEVGEAVASQWAEIGVKAKTSSPVWTQYGSLITSRKQAQIFMLGWGNPIWDADATLFSLLDKPKVDASAPDGSLTSYWLNPTAQNAIKEARSVSDPAKRLALYQQAEQIIHDEAPWIFLHQQRDLYAYNKAKIKWLARSDEQLNAFEISAAG